MDASAANTPSAVFCFVNGNADEAAVLASCFGAVCTIDAAEDTVTDIDCVRSSWTPAVAALVAAVDPASDILFTALTVASTVPAGI